LIINTAILTDFDGKSLRLFRYGAVLREMGYEVEFLTSDSTVKDSKFNIFQTKTKTGGFFGGAKYVPLFFELASTIRLTRFALFVLFRIVFYDYKLVLSSLFSPEIGSIAALVGCKIKRINHIYDYDDLAPEMSMTMKGWKKTHPLVIMQFAIEKFLCSKSEVVISMSDLMKNEIIYRTKASNVGVIYNTPIGTDLKGTKSIMDTREELDIEKDDFIFCYVGAIQSKVRSLEKVVGAVDILALRKYKFKFLMIGSGAGEKTIQNLIRQRKLGQKFLFTGPIEKNKALSYVVASNVSLVLLPPAIIGDYMAPAKLFISLGLGKNIIATNSAQVKRILGERATYVSSNFSEENLADAMEYAVQKYGLTEINHEFEQLFLEKYTWAIEKNKFKNLLSALPIE
jgi:glycosyltransferase involved in cell wall biosynthesis